MANYYDDLLLLLGYEQGEIDEERPRTEEAFKRMKVVPQDMEPAMEYVAKYHDVSLMGVRKLLGAYMKETIDAILAKDEGKKPVYFGFPAILGPGFVLSASSDDLFVAAPEMSLAHVLGHIFNKFSPIIVAGEKNGVPPGHALCSIWQAKLGAIAEGILPVPAMNISSSYFCDMSAHGDTLLKGKYGTPAVIIDGSMDGSIGEYPYIRPERIKFFGAQIDNALKNSEKILDIKITPDALEKGSENSKQFAMRMTKLFKLMQTDPVPLDITSIQLLEAMPGCSTRRGIKETIDALDILIPEVEERVKKGIGMMPKGAPRVILPHVHVTDPRCAKIIEEVGLAVPVTYVLMWYGGIPVKAEEGYPTLGQNIAAFELAQGMMFGGDAGAERIKAAIKYMNLDGFILKNLYNCRAVAGGSRNMKKLLADTDLPILNIEEDMMDSRIYSAEFGRTKLETFAEMLKVKKAWKTEDTWEDLDSIGLNPAA